MNTLVQTIPLFFSDDQSKYGEETMINRIISRTDAFTAKELGVINIQEMQEQARTSQKKEKTTPKKKQSNK